MGLRRFTWLTNALSEKWENHRAAVACRFTFYNFCRVHKSLRVTPTMAAGITDHDVWDVLGVDRSLSSLLIEQFPLACATFRSSWGFLVGLYFCPTR